MNDTAASTVSDLSASLDGGARPTLADRYQIDPTHELGGLSRPGATAYAANDLYEPTRSIYAVVAGDQAPIRLNAIHQTRQLDHESFTSPRRIGSVDWPLTGKKQTVLVLPRPRGAALMEDLDGRIEPVSPHRLVDTILPLIADMLAKMNELHVSHRAIRPDNIYFDADRKQLTVGECFSVPAGMAQPAIFEPIERAMCTPAGRGEGETADDLFALGVTILFLVLGYNPAAGIAPDVLLERRRQMGSYNAIVGEKRVPPELIQLIRSLLRDRADERWSVDDLLGWLDNGRGTAMQATSRVECERPFAFGNRKYNTPSGLALGLAADWDAAREIVSDRTVEKWVDKELKDKRCSAAIAKCRISGVDGPRTISDDLLLARTLSALDPCGPLRYRGLAVMLDGIGPLMASLIGDEVRMKQVVEMLNGKLHQFVMDQYGRPTYSMFRADEALTRVMPLLGQSAPGFGVERVLYELNPGLTCQSPLVLADNVNDVTQLLRALEANVAVNGAIFDRHIAAFVASRISGSVDRDLNDVSLARSSGDKLLAQLRLFSYAQGKSDAIELPGLCDYFLAESTAILETFHNLPLRGKLANAARLAAETGELAKIEKVLGSEKMRRWDDRGFAAARKEFRGAGQRIGDLQASFETIPERSRMAGKQIAASIAGAVGVIVTAIVTMSNLV